MSCLYQRLSLYSSYCISAFSIHLSFLSQHNLSYIINYLCLCAYAFSSMYSKFFMFWSKSPHNLRNTPSPQLRLTPARLSHRLLSLPPVCHSPLLTCRPVTLHCSLSRSTPPASLSTALLSRSTTPAALSTVLTVTLHSSAHCHLLLVVDLREIMNRKRSRVSMASACIKALWERRSVSEREYFNVTKGIIIIFIIKLYKAIL